MDTENKEQLLSESVDLGLAQPVTVDEISEVQIESKGKSTKNKKWLALFLGLFFTVVIVGIGLSAGFVWTQAKKYSTSPLLTTVAQNLQLPVAKINGITVYYADYLDDLLVLNKVYADQKSGLPTSTPEQISDQVTSRLLANKLVGQLADEFKVEVTEADLNSEKTDLVAKFSDEAAAEKELKDRYGWTLSKYMDKVVLPLLREKKLQAIVSKDTSDRTKLFLTDEVSASHILFTVEPITPKAGQTPEQIKQLEDKNDIAVKTKAQKVLDRIKAGEDFAKLAKEFGSDGTKDSGGSLGWFGRGQMVPEFEQVVFSLDKGQLSPELVKTQFGYHIVRVDDKRKSSVDFIAFMNSELKKAKIKFYLPIHNPFADFLEQASSGDSVTTK